MLVDFILHKANGTDTVELNKSIDGYSVVLNPKLHDVYNQVSYVEFDVAMSMDNYIEIGDWIEVDGKKYYSLTNFASFNARIAKGGTYNVRFYSPEQWLYKANMYATNEIYSGGVYSWERVDNTIVTVGNLESFGRWLCWNTNAQQNTRMFKLGNVPTGMNEQYEVLDFNPANCLSALYSICKTYKVRYEVVPNTEASPDSQYIINFYDTDEVFPVTFKYEEENGLYKLELTGCDEEVYTQFEIAGSTENIPSSYRDTRLRLSESISALSILDYPDLYDKWGRSIKILTYENIKPTRTGTVTDIVVDDIYSFIDSSLIGATWSPVGGTIQVVEGPLMGFSFECDYFNSTNGRVHIKPMTESNGMELPSADSSYYRFTAGATPTRYNVVGIALPDEYIEDAEARLLAAAMNDTSYYSDIRASYSLAISGTLLEEGEYEINAGVLVPIQHLGIGLDRSVRVQSITYDLSKPKYYDIEEIQLSDFRQEGLMDMVTEGVRKSVATLKDVGYTNKLNTFANNVSTIKQGIAKSLGYDSWEDFMEKTWNGDDGSWKPSTIIVDNLINSDLINVNTLIAREAFISTLLANEFFISGLPDAMPAESLLVDENGMIDFTATTSGGAAGLYIDSTKLGYWDGTAWKTYLANNGDFYLAGATAENYLTWISATNTLTVKGAIHALSGSIGGLTIAADKIYLGDGVYGGATTPFYVDDDGQMSLKDKFKWDGTNLTINGGGTFSGALSAATGSFAGSLSAATGTFSGSLSAASGTFEGLLDVGGIKIGLNAVNTGVDGLYIDTNNYWDENGNFKAGSTGSYIQWNGTTFAIKGDITGSTGTFGGVFAGTITAANIAAGTITANKLDISSLTTDSAFIESLATESAFIEELTGNTAFISALTVNSLSTVDSAGTSVSISNSAYSSKAGVVVSGSSGSVSVGFFDSVSAPALVAHDGTLGTVFSAAGVLGWGGGSFSLASGRYTVGETRLELQGAGSNYFSISSKSSGNAIVSNDEFLISKNELYISTLPTSTQTGGRFWSDSKGHVMVGAASAYTASDVGAVPTTRKVNSKALSSDITLSASDVSAVPTTRKVNSKALSSDITLSASDVSAVPATDIQYFTQAAWNALDSAQKAAIKLAIVY